MDLRTQWQGGGGDWSTCNLRSVNAVELHQGLGRGREGCCLVSEGEPASILIGKLQIS